MVKQILAAFVAGGVALSAVAMDLTEEQREEIARRLEPVGDVCLKGDSSCVVTVSAPAGGSAGGGAQVADASSSIDGEAVYNQACVACHSTGAGGAPMVGDVDQWEPRIAKGMEALHSSGIKGVAGTSMMAKGGRADLSDEQVVAAVNYMVEASQDASAPAGSGSAASDSAGTDAPTASGSAGSDQSVASSGADSDGSTASGSAGSDESVASSSAASDGSTASGSAGSDESVASSGAASDGSTASGSAGSDESVASSGADSDGSTASGSAGSDESVASSGAASDGSTASGSAGSDESTASGDAGSDGSTASGDTQVAVAASSIDGEAVYNQACVACHSTGVAGAPKVGDVEQWESRLAKGMDVLHSSGIKGVAGTAMMAKGGRADLSDAQVIAAVDYMVENSQ